MVKISRRDDAFSECFKLEAIPVEDQSLQQKENKRRKKGKAKKIKTVGKPEDARAKMS